MNATRFGAPWASPSRSVAVLRAWASSHGVAPSRIDATTAAGCVVAANVWSALTGCTHLADTQGLSAQACDVAAAILAAAAGHPSGADPDVDFGHVAPDAAERVYAGVDESVAWLDSQSACPACALDYASRLLAVGSSGVWQAAAAACLAPAGIHAPGDGCWTAPGRDGGNGD